MNRLISTITGAVTVAALAGAAFAAAHADKATLAAVKARQSHMQLYAFNIGLLGGMAKGDVEYDAEAATSAATNLATLATLNQMRYWPKGSDNEALGDETAALPAIWAEGSDVGAKAQALATATAAMQEAAGGGLDALRGAIGPVGEACGACHKANRKSDS